MHHLSLLSPPAPKGSSRGERRVAVVVGEGPRLVPPPLHEEDDEGDGQDDEQG